jgi:hypothetical protein
LDVALVQAALNRIYRGIAFAVAIVWLASSAGAQEPVRPRIFLRCPRACFESYLYDQLSYFDFVRAPHLADITLVVVRQPAANGGERFSVSATQSSDTVESTRMFTAKASATEHDMREELVQVALRALHVALEATPHERSFELSVPARTGRQLSSLDDPWDYWVIAPEINGNADGESGYYFAMLTGALTVRRITDAAKLRLRGSYTRTLTGYNLGDEGWIRGDVAASEGRGLYGLSVGRHWAIGATATARTSEFENLEGHVHGGPIAEANVFSYAESQRHQLRAAYQVGAWFNDYLERNEAGLMHETRAYHALSLIADINQPWGSVQWVGQVNSFIATPERYRLSTGAIVTLELWRGLAFSLEGEAAYVRDLINLRGRPIADEELILWTAQQRTDYMFDVGVSLVYTFGSIHNTVVNPRFARVDVEEE